MKSGRSAFVRVGVEDSGLKVYCLQGLRLMVSDPLDLGSRVSGLIGEGSSV